MSGIIEGYNYDIFISYRQKDNKGDKWVSEFVDSLKTELESTFKEEISVYFDINPHDGLLETHDVDASLKEKLKCLVFIPIISRTYCDPKSFAWEHEFKAFVEQASQNQFGLKIKLPNGNVASRVLPVRIHDLDTADIKECEAVLGGVLRGVEFIYKEPGIDKPLVPDDDERKNLNNTRYRIQIIKMAHAIKDLILGMRAETAAITRENDQADESHKQVRETEKKDIRGIPVKTGKFKFLSAAAALLIIISAAIIAYPILFKRDKLDYFRSKGEISVAVMPFQNMTNDTLWNVWQDGIQNELINNLTNVEELKVRQSESTSGLIRSKGLTSYASLTPSFAGEISQKLDANVFILGSIKQAGYTIRLNSQLIDSETGEVFRNFQIEDTVREENIFSLIDSLAVMIRDFLVITVLEKTVTREWRSYISTKYPEAYRYFINGLNAFIKRDYTTSRDWYLKALAIDSNLFIAKIKVAITYGNQGNYPEAKKWILKSYKDRERLPLIHKLATDYWYSWYFETPYEEIKYIEHILELDDNSEIYYYQLGLAQRRLQLFDKAIPAYIKSLEISGKLGKKPMWAYSYTALGYAYHQTGQYRKARKIYERAEKDFPGDQVFLYPQAVLALSEGRTKKAEEYIGNYISARKEKGESEAMLASSVGIIYWEAGIMDKAEEYLRQAQSLEPENPSILNNLAWLLIDNDINIDEGIGLIDYALDSVPDEYEYLDTKGWGLFKQGKYKEALEILQKSWDLRREKSIYNHEAYLHLEAAKKVVAGHTSSAESN